MRKTIITLCSVLLTASILSFMPATTVSAATIEGNGLGNYMVSVDVNTKFDTSYYQNVDVNTPGLSSIRENDVSDMETVDNQQVSVKSFDLEKSLKSIKKPTASEISQNKVALNVSKQSYAVGNTKTISVVSLKGGVETPYNMTVKMLYSGTHCTVWGDNANPISTATAQKLAGEYDGDIYNILYNDFGDMMDVDADGKLAICCYDIKDDFDPDYNPVGVAGYFNPIDLVGTTYGGNGNLMDMIHIDTNPFMSGDDLSTAYGTLIHEGQHCVNFSMGWVHPTKSPLTDTWMNEMLSQAASIMYDSSEITTQVSYYNMFYRTSGVTNSIYYWDGSLYNYALSTFFADYLAKQTVGMTGGGSAIYKIIERCAYSDWQAVEYALQQLDPNIEYKQFYANFRTALVANQPSGAYGFMGDPKYDKLKIVDLVTTKSNTLRPGGVIVTPVCGNQKTVNSDYLRQICVTSNKYAVTSSTYTIKDNLILGVSPNTTALAVKNALSSNYSLIHEKNGAAFSGMTIKVYDGQLVAKVVYAVVKGDIDGSGLVNASDLLKLKRLTLKLDKDEFYQQYAADINLDSNVNASDLLTMKRYLLSLTSL